ncbi:MAG: hypothetical protein LUC89_05840 [Oscillospiraceae bacterium]|nr:hypothetical protein [Oscillospiraceae bacterium]
MKDKKIVFIIVEGPSDSDALGVMFERYFNNNTVYIHITHCDLTTENGTNSSNVVTKITALVKQYSQRNHFSKSDFAQVIHLVDTDGVFIPDTCIQEDAACKKCTYTLTGIKHNNKADILQRNEQKRNCLLRLSTIQTVWKTIPYQIYYMSCNLDHVLYNQLNLSEHDKEEYSLAFAEHYKNDLNGFLHFISNSEFAVRLNYRESWRFIQQNLHSVERHTNLGLCFTSQSQEYKNKYI